MDPAMQIATSVGINIVQAMLSSNSVYGRMTKVIKTVESSMSVPPGTFPLPTVITIGKESAGKSSIMENVLKYEVFPRAENIMTKCPLRFETTNASEASAEIEWRGEKRRLASQAAILEAVRQIMMSLGDVISSEELIVRVKGPELVTMCYIDLPGIRTVPETLRKATHDLVERYLSDPHTIVMCIVPAQERLNADPALGLVITKKKAAQTILVLSKCDQVKAHVFEKNVVKRLLGTDDETPAFGLAGCIATSCRDQDEDGDDMFSLSEAGKKETAWIKKLLTPLRSHSSVSEIRANVGIANLLKQLEKLYYTYILTNWRPVAEKMVTQLISSATLERDKIGTDPRTLSPQTLCAEFGAKLKGKWPTAPVLRGFNDVTSARNSYDAAVQAATIAADFERHLDVMLDPKSPVCSAEIAATIDGAFDDVMPLRLARFGHAKSMLHEAAREALAKNFKLYAADMRRNALAELRVALRGHRVADVAAGVVTDAMYKCVLPAMQAVHALFADPESEWIKANAAALRVESPTIAVARKEAERKIAKLREALTLVSDIEKHVHADDDEEDEEDGLVLEPRAGAGAEPSKQSASAGQKRSRNVVS